MALSVYILLKNDSMIQQVGEVPAEAAINLYAVKVQARRIRVIYLDKKYVSTISGKGLVRRSGASLRFCCM